MLSGVGPDGIIVVDGNDGGADGDVGDDIFDDNEPTSLKSEN